MTRRIHYAAAIAAGLLALGLAQMTPLCADAHADPLGRAIRLYNASNAIAYQRAVDFDAAAYEVTECTLDGARGNCRARMFGYSNLGWVRADYTVRATWRAGRMTTRLSGDRWQLVTKQDVYDAAHPEPVTKGRPPQPKGTTR